ACGRCSSQVGPSHRTRPTVGHRGWRAPGADSVPADGFLVRPGAAGAAPVRALEIGETGVDLAEAVRGLGDPGVAPGEVQQLGDAVGGARGVLRARVPVALAVPEQVQAAEL